MRFIAEGREVISSLPVRKEVEQPQKLAVNAPRCRQARRQKRQRPIASTRLPVVADLVSGSLVKELVGPIRVAQKMCPTHVNSTTTRSCSTCPSAQPTATLAPATSKAAICEAHWKKATGVFVPLLLSLSLSALPSAAVSALS